MKAKSFSADGTVILLVTIGLASISYSRLQNHGHQHGDVLGRIMHKPTAVSSGGFLGAATNDRLDDLPMPTLITSGASCFGEGCFPLNTTEVLTPVTAVPQVQAKDLELRDAPTATRSSRDRQRFRALFHDRSSAMGIELDSIPSAVLSTKSPVILPSTLSHLPAQLGIKVQGPLEKVGAEDPELRNYSSPKGSRSRYSSKLIAPRQADGYQSFVLGGFSSPVPASTQSVAVVSATAYGAIGTSTSPSASLSSTSSSTATSSAAPSSRNEPSICPASNGTAYTSSDGINYQIVCNTDYLNNNLEFDLVNSFAGCVQKCDAWNYKHHQVQCVAALFLPNREVDVDDCYLKSKLVDPSIPSELIEGAIRLGFAASTSSSVATSRSTSATDSQTLAAFTSVATNVSSSNVHSSTSTSSAPTSAASGVSSPGVTYSSGDSVIVPKVASSHLQGPTQNTPTQQYLDIEAPSGITLAKSLLTVGANGDLTTGYDISGQTGVLEVNISTQSHLSSLKNTPHLSRDGGRGGMVNGEHLFVFCDTGSYSTTTSAENGDFLGFVSSSVATDVGMKGLSGGALNLQDGIGEWSDNAGRMRGFAPLTEGEVAYNQVMQGQGQRYAVWPESDIIPLDATTGIIYAPIVYDNVNELTKAAVFTYTGVTLLTITAGGKGGPVAKRTVEKIFQQDEVEWGCAGGIRSWGPSGIGGDDGSVYVFGNVGAGILLGRTSPAKVADVTAFQYWDGKSWTNDMPTSSSKAYFIAGSFMDVSVFYSPRHLTFIIVYLTIYADSTFYYRYLEADQGILPPFAPGGDSSSDYVEKILKYKWSEQQTLYKTAPGLSGKYIYSGGPHLGYYGSNDIINGGSKMLLSWTAPTGLDPSTLASEYQIVTAEIDWA